MSRGLESAYVRGLAVDPRDPARVHGLAEPAAWYTSTDGGETWTCVADTASFAGAATILAMTVIPQETPIFLVATPDGLWRSTDAGLTWQRPAVPAAVHQLAVSSTPTGLLVATDAGLYCSVDAGSTWSCCLAGTVTAVTTTQRGTWLAAQVLSDAAAPAIVISQDAGATWAHLGAAAGPVARLAAGDNFLLAIDRTGGLWYTDGAVDLSPTRWAILTDDLPAAFDLHVTAA